MKTYLSLIILTTLSLAACGQEDKPSTTPQASEANISTASHSSSVVAASERSNISNTQECTTVITSDDAMRFDKKEINIPSACSQYTMILKHIGKIPAAAMGHNIVIAKTIDKDGVLSDGAAAGIVADYVKVNDERVVAHTKLIGGGEEASVTVNTAKLLKDGPYEFFCSFPGHYAMMNGKIKIVD